MIHTLRETKRFLKESEGHGDLLVLMEDSKVCSKLLKMMNEALDVMLKRKRDQMLAVSVSITGPVRKKISNEKTDKIKAHEIESNQKLIETLEADLERLVNIKETLANPR